MKDTPVFRTVFGPVSSRRFGRSLGVDIIPKKLCTLDCVYCEVGRTDKRGLARKEYIPTQDIVRELTAALTTCGDLDCVTFSGSGEPTLHAGLGDLLTATHDKTDSPVIVLTNGTLLWREDVRRDLATADIVCPSLNAVSEDLFRRIDRPHPALSAHLVLKGLIDFRESYRGKYFLEILFVSGMNDTDEEVAALRSACERIAPDRIHINTVVRPPAETWAKPVPYPRLREIQELLGPRSEILVQHDLAVVQHGHRADRMVIVAMLSRRPMSREEITECLSAEAGDVASVLDALLREGIIHPVSHSGREFFAVADQVHLN